MQTFGILFLDFNVIFSAWVISVDIVRGQQTVPDVGTTAFGENVVITGV